MKPIGLILCLWLGTYGCSSLNPPKTPEIEYSFYVAGHIYGSPFKQDEHIHEPFREIIPFLNAEPTLEFGVLTGDVVQFASDEAWRVADSTLAYLTDPYYIAAGNHDVGVDGGYREEYEKQKGKTFYYHLIEDDLFIFLDPNLAFWNIEGEQLTFLRETLDTWGPGAEQIFVFFHQVLWWSPDNLFKNFHGNSVEGRAESINFWTEVEPLFHAFEKPVYMFAGDVGAFYQFGSGYDAYFYYAYDHIHLIASGMGNFVEDNLVIVDVMDDHTTRFRLIALNGTDRNRLGELTDYVIP
ncbi:MAG: metallophosphoesterase [Bacteroidota bacterium]